MALTDKYNAVIAVAQANGTAIANFHEENGMLVINATAPTPFAVNQIWDKLKECAGVDLHTNPSDVQANIVAQDSSLFHRHTVVGGDSLSKIAKHYYGEANKYHQIFEANTDILKDPDHISVGQELVIPNI